MHTHALYIALTGLDVLSVVTLIGVVACWRFVLTDEPVSALDETMRHLLLFATALLTASSAGILLSRTLEMVAGRWGAVPSALPAVLSMTHYGHIWLLRIPALMVLWLGQLRARCHRCRGWQGWAMTLAVAGIAMTRSESGHPADAGDLTVAVWIDWLHLVAGGVWVGSLFAMSLGVFPQLLARTHVTSEQVAEIFQRLSRLAGAALAVILLSGTYTAWRELGGLDELWTTAYGRVLSGKITLVALMIGFGIYNRYVGLPGLLRVAGRPVAPVRFWRYLPLLKEGSRRTLEVGGPIRNCARAVLVESLLGAGVIAAASLLLHQMPAAKMHGMPMSLLQRPAAQFGLGVRGSVENGLVLVTRKNSARVLRAQVDAQVDPPVDCVVLEAICKAQVGGFPPRDAGGAGVNAILAERIPRRI